MATRALSEKFDGEQYGTRAPTGAKRSLRAHWPRWVCAAGAAAVLSSVGLVHAQAADSTERDQPTMGARREAKAELTRGKKLFEAKRYAEALEAFRGAYAGAPSAEAQEHVALTLLATGALVDAHAAYVGLLERHGSELGKQRRERAESALRDLSNATGTVELVISEPGASVQVDGAPVGTTPLAAPLRLVRGAHVVRVTKDGFKSLVVDLAVDSESVRIEKSLEVERAVAQVSITSSAGRPGELWVDGQRAGSLPWQGEIAEGEHVIQARSNDHASTEQRISVRKGAQLNLNLALLPVPATVRAFGGDPATVIKLDGRVVGHGKWEGKVEPGTHELEIWRPGFHPSTRTIHAEPNGLLVLPEPDLQPANVPTASAPAAAPGSGSPMADRGAQGSSADDSLERYRGVYAQLALAGLFSKSATNEISVDCPAQKTGGNCESMAPAGGAAQLRIGYSFGWLGVEGIALASGDVSRTTAEHLRDTTSTQSEYYGVARNEDYTFFRYGWGGGAALRATSPTGTVRFTGSLGGGFMQRSARYLRVSVARDNIPGTSLPAGAKHLESEVLSYVAPVLIADAGITIGSSPGARFYLGGLLMVEAGQGQATVPGKEQRLGFNSSGNEQSYGTPAVDVTRGPVVQFGPVLGVVFGS